MNSKELRQQADSTFTKRLSLLSLWQEQAENFYPERADFTFRRYLGDDFAGNLMTSYPILCRRDMGDQVSTMLRNNSKEWFHMTVADAQREDHEAKGWLQWATGTMRRAMYDPVTLFTRATKETDNDFVTFGQGVISVRLNHDRDALLYRCWHLRDVAWLEDEEGRICAVFRRSKPPVHTVKRLFDRPSMGCKISTATEQMFKRNMFEEIDCLHIMIRSELYDGPATMKKNARMPWVSIHYDCAHDFEMQCVQQRNKEYVIPRWQTVSGSQYAYSPATVAALPEARLLQAMTSTLLEAGEKIVNPPMVAVDSVIRSDMGLYAGGVTWVDPDYDERLGEALRPLTRDARGMPLSMDMQKDSRQILMQCFFLNKLSLPQRGADMTAYEVSQRIQEYIRSALPLFEPMEADYNGALCEETFEVMDGAGAFGPEAQRPESLQGPVDVRFRFASPLHDAIEQLKGQKFMEMKQIIAEAVALDKNIAAIPNAVVAVRDALEGTGVPQRWIRSETEAKAMVDKANAEQQTAELLATMQGGADVAKTMSESAKNAAAAQQAQPA